MSRATNVYLLWHVHHRAEQDGEIRHFTSPDDYWSDEEEGDDVKRLGVYSTREKAQERVVEARKLPGFSSEPQCFYIEEALLDEDEWPEGYVEVARPPS